MAATGSITVTASDVGDLITKYAIAWTSDASGNVSGNTLQIKKGRLKQVKFVPGAGGVQPSDLYDVTMTDADGADVLVGAGANLSQANASWSAPSNPVFLEEGTFTPVVANAGVSKQGTINLYVGP